MLLWDAIDVFIDHLRQDQGLSPNTCHGYRMALRDLARFLAWGTAYLPDKQTGGKGEPLPAASPPSTVADFTSPALRRWVLDQLERRKLAKSTVRVKFFAAVSFGRYLEECRVLPEGLRNPAASVRLPRIDKPRPRREVTDEEARLLLLGCERLRSPRRCALARAVFSVFLYAGLRRQELLNLRIADFDLAQDCLFVQNGKGNKSRPVFPHLECVTALREWLTYRPRNCQGPHADYLFMMNVQHRMGGDTLDSLFTEVKAAAGLAADGDHIKPHDLRHAAATRLMRAGADISSIQTLLGHSSIVTTSMYLHSDAARQKDVSRLGGLFPPAASARESSASAPLSPPQPFPPIVNGERPDRPRTRGRVRRSLIEDRMRGRGR